MNISPQTNLSSPVNSEQKTIFTDNNSPRSSTKDIASVSSTAPSVKVSLSSSDNAVAAANTKIPPLYSRPSIADANQTRLRTDDSPQILADADVIDGKITSVEEKVSEDKGDSRSLRDKEAGDEDARSVDAEAENTEQKRQATHERNEESLESEAESRLVEQLKARDLEVRSHEQAHKAVGGQYTGAIALTYQTGPDGKRYAVGGEVPIDVSKVPDDPNATIAKMQTVKAAANAPAEPSPQDRAVVAEASRILSQAQSELAAQNREKAEQAKADSSEASDDSDEEKTTTTSNASYVASFQEISGIDLQEHSAVDTII